MPSIIEQKIESFTCIYGESPIIKYKEYNFMKHEYRSGKILEYIINSNELIKKYIIKQKIKMEVLLKL